MLNTGNTANKNTGSNTHLRCREGEKREVEEEAAEEEAEEEGGGWIMMIQEVEEESEESEEGKEKRREKRRGYVEFLRRPKLKARPAAIMMKVMT